jgi:hypothetical protein
VLVIAPSRSRTSNRTAEILAVIGHAPLGFRAACQKFFA